MMLSIPSRSGLPGRDHVQRAQKSGVLAGLQLCQLIDGVRHLRMMAKPLLTEHSAQSRVDSSEWSLSSGCDFAPTGLAPRGCNRTAQRRLRAQSVERF